MSDLPDDLFVWLLCTWSDASVRGKLACSTRRCGRLVARAISLLTGPLFSELLALPLATVFSDRIVSDTPVLDYAVVKPIAIARGLALNARVFAWPDRAIPAPLRVATVNSVRHKCSLVVRAELTDAAGRWSLTVIKRTKNNSDVHHVTIRCGDLLHPPMAGVLHLRVCSSPSDYVFIDIVAKLTTGKIGRYFYRCDLNGAQRPTVTSLISADYDSNGKIGLPFDAGVDLRLRIGYLGYLLGLYSYYVTITGSAVTAVFEDGASANVSNLAQCSIATQVTPELPLPSNYKPIQAFTSVLLVPKCFRVDSARDPCEVIHGSNITLLALTLSHHRGCWSCRHPTNCVYLMPINPLNGQPLTKLAWRANHYLLEDVIYAHWGDERYESGRYWCVGVRDKTDNRFKVYRNDNSLVYCAAANMILNA